MFTESYEHWSKPVFKAYGVSFKHVAHYLRKDYTHVVKMLNGFCRVTEENEEKLKQLVRELEGNNV